MRLGPIHLIRHSTWKRYIEGATEEGEPARARQPADPPADPRVVTRAQYRSSWQRRSHTEGEAMFAIAAHTDEDTWEQTAQATKRTLVECVGIRPEDTVLEIGCGMGRVGDVVAPLCKEWIGADVSENMLGHLRRRLIGHRNVRTVLVSGYDLAPIPDESVDMVYCTVVFMHLDEWERFSYVREGFRVLRPGGRMLVDNINLLSDEGWARLCRIIDEIDPRERPEWIGTSSTPQELETYFRRAGFESIGQRFENIWVFTYGSKPAAPR